MNLLIIGSGAAGISALQTVKEIDNKIKINLISKDTKIYSPCALPYYILDKVKSKNLIRFDKTLYKGIGYILGRSVSKVQPEENNVVLEDSKKISYDTLLIATGSLPLQPKIGGIDKKNVFYLSRLDDTIKIKKLVRTILNARHTAKAVIIGAGFTGLECAIALKKLGLEVTVVEMLDKVLPKMLDNDIAAIVKQILEANGIEILLKEQVVKILGDDKVNGIALKNSTLDCKLVIVGVGVRPNIDLVRDSNIKTNIGIIVNERMQTSVGNVYAAGDVAEAVDLISKKLRVNAIWPTAIEQGTIAGANIAGQSRLYEGFYSINVIDIFGVPVVAIGYPSSELTDYEELKTQRGTITKKLLLKNNKMMGLQSIGELKNTGLFLSLMRKGIDISNIKNELLKEKFAYPLLYGTI